MTAPDLTDTEWTALWLVATEGYHSPFLKLSSLMDEAAGSALAKIQAARIDRAKAA